MFKCKVSSGEFEIVIVQHSLIEAVNEAIRLHDQHRHNSILGDFTMVEELDVNDEPTGAHLFLRTKILIELNTQEGCGSNQGQYRQLKGKS